MIRTILTTVTMVRCHIAREHGMVGSRTFLSNANPCVTTTKEVTLSLEFANNWNVERAQYVAQYGSYQNLLNLLTESDVTQALKIASILYHEGAIGDMIRAAINSGGERVVVEQGSHQLENRKDAAPQASVRGFDFNPTKTLHFTLRHFKTGGPPHGRAFHCYLSQNTQKQWGITTITYVQQGAGIQMGQTGARDFMAQLAKNFVMAHGIDD